MDGFSSQGGLKGVYSSWSSNLRVCYLWNQVYIISYRYDSIANPFFLKQSDADNNPESREHKTVPIKAEMYSSEAIASYTYSSINRDLEKRF